jgi:hypothetical protein
MNTNQTKCQVIPPPRARIGAVVTVHKHHVANTPPPALALRSPRHGLLLILRPKITTLSSFEPCKAPGECGRGVLAGEEERRQGCATTHHGDTVGQATPSARERLRCAGGEGLGREGVKQRALLLALHRSAELAASAGHGITLHDGTHPSNPIFANIAQLRALLSKHMASTVVMPHCAARASKCSTSRRPTPPARVRCVKCAGGGGGGGKRTADVSHAAEYRDFSRWRIAFAVLIGVRRDTAEK